MTRRKSNQTRPKKTREAGAFSEEEKAEEEGREYTDEGKKTEYLLLGAPVSPEGTRLLYLLPKPHWTLEPSSALSNGELYAPK